MMIYVLPVSAHKLDAAGFLVKLVIILRDPLSVGLIILLIIFNFLVYSNRQILWDHERLLR